LIVTLTVRRLRQGDKRRAQARLLVLERLGVSEGLGGGAVMALARGVQP